MTARNDEKPIDPAALMTADERRGRFLEIERIERHITIPLVGALPDNKPIACFDIDGVIAPIDGIHQIPTPGFRWGGKVPHSSHDPFTEPDCYVHPLVVDWLEELEERFTCVWISSWGQYCAYFAANIGAKGAVDWPHAALTLEDLDAHPNAAEKIDRTAVHLPANAPVVFIDDHLDRLARAGEMARAGEKLVAARSAPTLLVAPTDRVGLHRSLVDYLIAFAKDPGSARYRFASTVPNEAFEPRGKPDEWLYLSWPDRVDNQTDDPVWPDPYSNDTPGIGDLWELACDPFHAKNDHVRERRQTGEDPDSATRWGFEAREFDAVHLPNGAIFAPALPCLRGYRTRPYFSVFAYRALFPLARAYVWVLGWLPGGDRRQAQWSHRLRSLRAKFSKIDYGDGHFSRAEPYWVEDGRKRAARALDPFAFRPMGDIPRDRVRFERATLDGFSGWERVLWWLANALPMNPRERKRKHVIRLWFKP